nr:hypothetical protein [Tanacetum cinerariifolium]
MVAWFLRLEDHLRKSEAIVVLRNAIALFRLVIRLSLGKNDGIAVLGVIEETLVVIVEKLMDLDMHVEELVMDFSYQINNRMLNKGRRENMPYPKFTKVIINHFLSLHNSIPKGLPSGLNTIKDDGNLSRMKFVRIGEDVQEYGKAISDTMPTNAIKQS